MANVEENTRNQRALDDLHKKQKDYEEGRGRVLKQADGEEIVDNQQAAMMNGVHSFNRDGMQGMSLDTGARPKVLPNDGTVGAELMRTSTAIGAQGKAINAAPDTPFIEESEEPVLAEDEEPPLPGEVKLGTDKSGSKPKETPKPSEPKK